MTRSQTAPRSFDGEIAVITGTSSGIGRRLALDLAARGATVIGVARRQALLDDLRGALQAETPTSDVVACDVGDVDAFRRVLKGLEERHGRIDVLVNNAGIDRLTWATEEPYPDLTAIMDVNFMAAATATFAVMPGMVRRGHGSVVNVSSDTVRAPEPGQAAYAASKAALAAFTESIAHEVAPRGVHVHVLYPGWVPTAMGLSGAGDGGSLPPKAVRRTEAQISDLVLQRMGGSRIDINAAWLPLLAPLGRTFAPGAYQRAMRRMATTGGTDSQPTASG